MQMPTLSKVSNHPTAALPTTGPGQRMSCTLPTARCTALRIHPSNSLARVIPDGAPMVHWAADVLALVSSRFGSAPNRQSTWPSQDSWSIQLRSFSSSLIQWQIHIIEIDDGTRCNLYDLLYLFPARCSWLRPTYVLVICPVDSQVETSPARRCSRRPHLH